MKKLISVLLLIALFCTAFAGSAFALTEDEEALYAKYADLIALMENEDYEAAYEAFQAMMPEPEYEEVVLTEENFFDYFEIVTAEPYIERDSAGVIKTVYPGGLQLRMKEDFAKRLDWENSTLSVGITAKKDMYRARSISRPARSRLGIRVIPTSRRLSKNSTGSSPRSIRTSTAFILCTP